MPTNPRRRKIQAATAIATGLALAGTATAVFMPAKAGSPALNISLGELLDLSLDIDLNAHPKLAVSPVGQIGGLGAEIVAYDKINKRAWVTDAANGLVTIVDIRNPAAPVVVRAVSLTPTYGLTVTSVAISGKHVVVATRPDTGAGALARGQAVLLDLAGNITDSATLGYGPDAVTFTPDGDRVLIANEGEPTGYTAVAPASHTDPAGSVSILKVANGKFKSNAEVTFNGLTSVPAGVRISGPPVQAGGPVATIAQDLEPEYVTVTPDSETAYVSLQENNAVGEINIGKAKLTAIRPAGYADHSQAANALDTSDRLGSGQAGVIDIEARPGLLGMRMPDGVASFSHFGRTYYVTANEGDGRDYSGFPGGADNYADDRRVSAIPSGQTPAVWGASTASFLTDPQMGRLTVTRVAPWVAGGPIYAYGSRSFSIFDDKGTLVFDSGSDFERITAGALPTLFNSSHEVPDIVLDNRSDNKGPEPEGVAIGYAYGRRLAAITLERVSGIMVYDVTDPRRPSFVSYVPATPTNYGPEGVVIVPAIDSPTRKPLILTASEIGNALSIYQVTRG